MRRLMFRIVGFVVVGMLWPTPAVAQECEGLLSRWFGPKCISSTAVFKGNSSAPASSHLSVSTTWSETSAENDNGTVIITVRLIFNNWFTSEDNGGSGWVLIQRVVLELLNDDDLELSEVIPTIPSHILVNPGGAERFDFRYSLNPGFVDDAASTNLRLSFEFCNRSGSECYRHY